MAPSHAADLTLPAGGAAPSGRVPLPDAQHEAQVFWRLRRTLLRSALRRMFSQSRLRTALIVILSAAFWASLYAVFYEGFSFVQASIPGELRAEVVQAVFNVFFISLMLMLVVSSGIILYGGLYRDEEAAFLLTMPVRVDRVFLHKFQETIALCSWGFVLLGSPMLVSYGVVAGAPWYYYAMMGPMVLAFVFIPCSVGAVCCMLVVRYLPVARRHLLGLVAAALIGAALWAIWALVGVAENDLLTSAWFQDMLARLRYSEQRLLPSWWLAGGLIEAARQPSAVVGDQPWAEGAKFMCLLLANALFFHQAAVWSAAWLYRTSYGNITAGGRPRRRPAAAWLDALVMRLAVFVPRDVRLLMVKDLRLFRRDPVQWSQFLIFFGLLGFYFINIRRYRYDVNFVGWWVNMISFLNLAVIGLILSTFTTRFVFPMISLEGRRFWFLGLLPISRGRILWGKFLFAAIGSTVCCNTLIAVSDAMLRIDPWVVAMHQVTCAVLCVGLSAIAVGLGARLPDLREQSPARIAAGFGGTLNLVLSAMYIVVVVLLTAIPCHLYIHFLQSQPNVSPDNDHLRQLRAWMIQAALASVALGLLVTALTLSTGLRAFRKMEF